MQVESFRIETTTLREALERLITLGASESSQIHLTLRVTCAGVWLECRGSTPFEAARADFAEHYMVALLTRFVAHVLDRHWHPLVVHLQAREPQALERFLDGSRFALGCTRTWRRSSELRDSSDHSSVLRVYPMLRTD